MKQGTRQFLRELTTGLAGPNAAAKRLRMLALVKLCVALPFVLGPTAAAFVKYLPNAGNPDAARYATILWFSSVGVIIVTNLAIVLLYRPAVPDTPARDGALRLLT